LIRASRRCHVWPRKFTPRFGSTWQKMLNGRRLRRIGSMSDWKPRIVLGVVALLLANLLIVLGLAWHTERNSPGSQWLGYAVMSAVLSQIILCGVWLGLGDGRWYWRILISVVFMMALAKCFGWASEWNGKSHDQGNAEEWPRIAFFFIFVLLVTCAVVLPLRRLRQWRLTWQTGFEAAATPQFQIGDILVWMIPIGAVLGLMRFLASLIDNGWQSLLDALLPLAEMAALTWCAMLAAYATRRRVLTAIALLCLALLMGSAFATPDIYRGVLRAQAVVRGPIAWQVYFANAFPYLARHWLSALSCAWSAWVNCTILRLLGCKLIRPGNLNTSPG
jgi:hypothetical protein